MALDVQELLLTIRGDLSQDELAQRAGVNRVTLARWETGVAGPRLEDVFRLAVAAGKTLDIKVGGPVNRRLINGVNRQLDLGPTARMRRVAGERWASLRAGLQVAAWAVDEAAVIGPAAAAVRGAPQPVSDQVDLVTRATHVRSVLRAMQQFANAALAGTETSPDPTFQRHVLHTELGGVVTVADAAAGIADIGNLVDRSHVAFLNAEDIGMVRFALAEDLADIARHSPWPSDHEYERGLSAVLASGRYSTRDPVVRDAA